MRLTSLSCVVLSITAFFTTAARAELRLPAIFTDHLVLQRDLPAPVWGWADPGDTVTVAIAGQTAAATADDEGKWMVKLAPLPAGGPHTLTVTTGDETLTREDVLVGEVWLASGQSNMGFPLKQTENDDAAAAAADLPRIRLFTVPRTVAQEPLDDATAEWQVCSPKTVRGFSAVAYYFGRKLHGELDVPIGLIRSARGGTMIEAWTSRPMLESLEEAQPILKRYETALAEYPQKRAEWEKAIAEIEARGDASAKRPRAPLGPESPNGPSVLFNGMIHPLVPYGLRGVIWYQGESNADRAEQYRTLFPAMIRDWRERWDAAELPFLFVQLANFKAPTDAVADTPWAHLRDAQLHTLRTVPHTGMAVTIDIGQADDIHPRNKLDVGERLARWALVDVYGREGVVKSGPIVNPDGVRMDGRYARLVFDHAHELQTRDGGPLRGFTAAGPTQKFVKADARLVEVAGRPAVEVELPAEAGDTIAAVRYAWEDNPDEANLVNGEGLPASPFRTDSWPGPTDGKR